MSENPPDNKDTGSSTLKSKAESNTDDEFTTAFETYWNICNTIQGLPILAIPYTFKSGGWWTLITLVIVASASNYTSIILVKCLYEVRNGVKIRVRHTYLDIGEAFWKGGGRRLVLVMMVIELLFISTMFPILVGSMFAKSFPEIKIPLWAWTMIGGAAVLPNALLKDLSQIAWTSIMTVICTLVIFFAVISYSFTSFNEWDLDRMDVFDPQEFPSALGILVACYLAQPFVPLLESTMKQPKYFSTALNYSYLSMTVLNALIGFVTCLAFYPDIDTVVTNNLPEGIFRQLMNSLAAVLAFISYSIPMFLLFEVLENSNICIPVGKEKKIFSIPVQSIRLPLLLLTVFMAAFVHKFIYLMAFVGSVSGITLEFIFPALFQTKIYCTKLSRIEFSINIFIVFAGTLTMSVSLIVTWVTFYACLVEKRC